MKIACFSREPGNVLASRIKSGKSLKIDLTQTFDTIAQDSLSNLRKTDVSLYVAATVDSKGVTAFFEATGYLPYHLNGRKDDNPNSRQQLTGLFYYVINPGETKLRPFCCERKLRNDPFYIATITLTDDSIDETTRDYNAVIVRKGKLRT